MKKWLDQIRQFIEVDLWRVKLNRLPKRKKIYFGLIRVWVIAIKEFIADKCAEKASALTYLSMLSLVPILALVFAIAKSFGLQDILERELERYLSGQTEILNQVQPSVDRLLSSTSGGIVAGISAIFLIYTVIRLLMNIEAAFNDMWDIKKSRRWERKISDYVAVILLGPILLIVASSATVFVTETIQDYINEIEFLEHLKSGIIFLLKLLPYTILWFFTFWLIPNFSKYQSEVHTSPNCWHNRRNALCTESTSLHFITICICEIQRDLRKYCLSSLVSHLASGQLADCVARS